MLMLLWDMRKKSRVFSKADEVPMLLLIRLVNVCMLLWGQDVFLRRLMEVFDGNMVDIKLEIVSNNIIFVLGGVSAS